MEKFKNVFIYLGFLIWGIILVCGSLENGIFLSILTLGGIYFFVSKVKIKKFLYFLVPFCLITKVVVVFILDTPIVADFMNMYATAQNLISNGLHDVHPYYNVWGYQLFHVFYEALVLKLFNSPTSLEILNSIYSTIITCYIYLIAKKLCNEKAARITSLLYACSIYPLYLNTILANHQLALVIALSGIYVLLYKKQCLRNMAFVGLLYGVSNLERSEGIVFIFATLVYLFVSDKRLMEFGKKSLVLLLCFFLVTKSADFIVRKLDINDIGLGNANPEWKFLLGFNYDTNGVYSEDDEVYLGDIDKQKEEIVNRMTDFKRLPSLFYNKTKIQFLYEGFGRSFDELNISESASPLKETIFSYTKVMNYVIYILAFIGLFSFKKVKKEYYFFIIYFLTNYAVYMLTEICARYYYNPQMSLFVLSSVGIMIVCDLLEKKKIKCLS